MPFAETQAAALAGKLSAKHVKTREEDGMTLSYIEGWHAIAEANRIFGFDGWDRQTVTIRCVSEGAWQGRYRCL
ncbi:MAG: Rad52/Rad22 family DNA repair protein [Acidimicrobiia bacterium]